MSFIYPIVPLQVHLVSLSDASFDIVRLFGLLDPSFEKVVFLRFDLFFHEELEQAVLKVLCPAIRLSLIVDISVQTDFAFLYVTLMAVAVSLRYQSSERSQFRIVVEDERHNDSYARKNTTHIKLTERPCPLLFRRR